MDSKSGCTRWSYDNDSIPVRTAMTLGKIETYEAPLLFFGDNKGFVTALDARTGQKLWKTQVDTHPEALITGAITLYKDRLYVAVSSLEVVKAMNPMYNCCTFRGSVVRLDALSGNRIWQTFTTPEPQKTVKNALGVQMWGPSGAPVWNSPAIDTKRNLLYVGTGENYSSPASQGSDSVLALDLDSGALRWAQQLTTGDAWNMSCTTPGKLNCPKEDGFDLDVGANTILHQLADGRDLVIAGQKAGWVWALDPDQAGKPAWKTKVGRGGALGGIHWGMGSDDFIYAPNSDYELNFLGIIDAKRPEGKKIPSLNALDPASGAIAWQHVEPFTCPNPVDCDDGFSAPPTVIPGVVFAGTLKGKLRAFDRNSGKILWEQDTTQNVAILNGPIGHGGSIDVDGVVIADGHVYVHSGYGKLGHDGNVLLVYSIDGK